MRGLVLLENTIRCLILACARFLYYLMQCLLLLQSYVCCLLLSNTAINSVLCEVVVLLDADSVLAGRSSRKSLSNTLNAHSIAALVQVLGRADILCPFWHSADP